MNPKLGETIYLDFITSDDTGAATDADALPTCKVFKNATDAPILTPAVTKRVGETGNYRVAVACTADNGFEERKSYSVVIAATVGGIAAKAVIGNFQLAARTVDDLVLAAAARN